MRSQNSMAQATDEARRHYGEYGVTARFYDAVYAEIGPQDIGFYLELAARCEGPILELGCGTGRVTLPLLRAGHSVTALDLSPAMLDELMAKLAGETEELRSRVELVEGSMAGFELGGQYGLILCPFRAFQHLLSTEDQRACLSRVAAHLSDEGRFVYNAFDPSPTYMAQMQNTGQVWRMDFEGRFDEQTLRRYVLLNYRIPEQLLELRMKFELCDEEGRVSDSWIEKLHMRWQYRFEAEYLLELCGLSIESAYGAFDRRAPLEGRELIYVCRRSG